MPPEIVLTLYKPPCQSSGLSVLSYLPIAMLLFQDAKPGPCLPAQHSTLDNVELKKQGAAILGMLVLVNSNMLLHDNKTSLTNVCALQRLCWSLLGKAMFKVSTSTGINLFFFYFSYTVILGFLVFHLSASQESSFLLRKNVNIRICGTAFCWKKRKAVSENSSFVHFKTDRFHPGRCTVVLTRNTVDY